MTKPDQSLNFSFTMLPPYALGPQAWHGDEQAGDGGNENGDGCHV